MILFLGAFSIETILAVFSISTRSYQYKIRSIARITVFIFILWMLGSRVINWGFSYYSLIAWLLIFVVMGAAALVHERDRRRIFNAAYVVFNGIVVTVIIFLLTLPAILFPGYQRIEASGEYQVSSAMYTFIDSSRIETFSDSSEYRKLNVGFWYPGNAKGRYPLIVFSHGGISTRASNESLYHELASNGYIICAIDHSYHSLFTTDEDGRTVTIDFGYLQELGKEDAKSNRQQSYEYYQKWMSIRIDDISFVIDQILLEAANTNSDPLYKLVDSAKVGVMGHSAGGSAALGMGRVRNDIGAVVALEAPFLWDIEGVEYGEFVFTDETYPVPLLNVYSDSSWNHLADWPQYAQNHNLILDRGATVFNVHIAGAGHFSLTDLALSSPILTRLLNGFKSTTRAESCLKTINKISTEFLDCYLKGNGVFAPD